MKEIVLRRQVLFNYVRDLHTEASNKVNWLDKDSNQAAKFLETLGNTRSAEFISLSNIIEKDQYVQELYKAIDLDNITDVAKQNKKDNVLKSLVNDFINGNAPDSFYPDGQKEGVWNTVSRNMVNASDGNIMVIAQDIDTNKVFYQTELEAIMKNDKITHVNGFEKSQFLKTWNRTDLTLEQKKIY